MAVTMQTVCNAMNGAKAVIMMVLVQAIFAGLSISYEMVSNDGMSHRVVIAYRFVFATAFMIPMALIFERKNGSKLTWKVFGQAFINGLIGGSLNQNLYIESIAMTSATYTAAMTNLLPGMTFVLAIGFGMEKLRLRTMAGKAKVVGTLLGICGAMLLTFYKGIEIDLWSTHINLLKKTPASGQHSTASHAAHKSGDQILGSIYALCSCFCYASWIIFQAKVNEIYPAHYTNTALMNLMAAIQAVVYAICREKDWSQWKLHMDIRLYALLYMGIFVSGVSVILMSWCVSLRGPLFVSTFKPLLLVFVALAGSLILDERRHLGSILGGGVIVLGLYFVIWGQAKEMKVLKQPLPATSKIDGQLPDVAHDIKTGIEISSLEVNIDLPKDNNAAVVAEVMKNNHHEVQKNEEDHSVTEEKEETHRQQ